MLSFCDVQGGGDDNVSYDCEQSVSCRNRSLSDECCTSRLQGEIESVSVFTSKIYLRLRTHENSRMKFVYFTTQLDPIHSENWSFKCPKSENSLEWTSLSSIPLLIHGVMGCDRHKDRVSITYLWCIWQKTMLTTYTALHQIESVPLLVISLAFSFWQVRCTPVCWTTNSDWIS